MHKKTFSSHNCIVQNELSIAAARPRCAGDGMHCIQRSGLLLKLLSPGMGGIGCTTYSSRRTRAQEDSISFDIISIIIKILCDLMPCTEGAYC